MLWDLLPSSLAYCISTIESFQRPTDTGSLVCHSVTRVQAISSLSRYALFLTLIYLDTENTSHQLAISRLPGSALSAVIGILTGQIYRSDLAGLNTYRLPPSIIRFAGRFLSPLIGSLRPPRRSNRALPDDRRAGGPRTGSSQLNEEVITTAQTPGPSGTAATTGDTTQPRNGPSVMREWVDELTGRADRANAGLRAPTESEINHLTAMFPTLEREVVIGALQRR